MINIYRTNETRGRQREENRYKLQINAKQLQMIKYTAIKQN